MVRNQFIEMAMASLADLMKDHTEYWAGARQDIRL